MILNCLIDVTSLLSCQELVFKEQGESESSTKENY